MGIDQIARSVGHLVSFLLAQVKCYGTDETCNETTYVYWREENHHNGNQNFLDEVEYLKDLLRGCTPLSHQYSQFSQQLETAPEPSFNSFYSTVKLLETLLDEVKEESQRYVLLMEMEVSA